MNTLSQQPSINIPDITQSSYICPECNKSFSTNGNMKNHIQTIHKHIRPFKCPYISCNKEYSNKSRLDVHIRTHTGNKPFICPICFKSFNEKGNLKTHINFHTEQRPFKCPKCDKTYKTNGHLKDHIEIQHLNLRRFECQFCNNKFGRRSTLMAHIRTHTGEKTYKCYLEGCEKYFAEKGNMEMHYKRHLKKENNNSNVNYVNSNVIKNKSNVSLYNDSVVTRPSSDLTININDDNNNKKDDILKEENNFWRSLGGYESSSNNNNNTLEFQYNIDDIFNIHPISCRKGSSLSNFFQVNNINNEMVNYSSSTLKVNFD